MLKKNISFVSHIGSGYRNWDRYGVSVNDESLLAIIADGVGGQIMGGIAAGMVVDKFNLLHKEGKLSSEDIPFLFDELSVEMRKVCMEMATTVILIFIIKRGEKLELYYTWAGDSRFFLLTERNLKLLNGVEVFQKRRKKLCILTDDDTFPWKYYRNGDISLDKVTRCEGKNRLLFSLPRNGERMRDRIVKIDVEYGDKILLCTDGFWELFREQSEIMEWMTNDINDFESEFIRFLDSHVEKGVRVDNATGIRIDLENGILKGK